MRISARLGVAAGLLLLAACGGDQAAADRPTSPADEAGNESPGSSQELPAAPFLPDCEANPPGDDIAEFQCGWAYRALSYQRQLGLHLPLREAQVFSSHNSYNSSAYPGISSSDLNQTRTLPEQFQIGVRSFELDVHWIPHALSGGLAPVTCHGLSAGQEHLGCTAVDRHLDESLNEIAAFLESEQGQNQVLFLDLEDHLSPAPLSGAGSSSEEAHAAALAAITATLGEYIYQPEQDAGCQATPMSLTQAEILAAGKNILLNAPCDHAGWGNWAFEVGSARPGQKAHTGFSGYPDCDSESYDFAQYRERWVREWEDTTLLGAGTNSALQRMSDTNLQDMAHCGVSFSSLDRVDPNPPPFGLGNPNYVGEGVNFAALVWSWAQDKPARNETLECAYLATADGRFHDAQCEEERAYACMQEEALATPITSAEGLWQIVGSGAFDDADCPAGTVFARPENGWLKQQLVETAERAGIEAIWIRYQEVEPDNWQ